jgi:uncharacterized membrane protein YccC
VNRRRQAARLREAVVPGWLAEVVRPRRTAIPWAEMIRAGIAICVPLSVAIAVGQRGPGLLIAMGGLMGTVVDTGGPYVARVKRVGSAAVFGGAVGLAIGSVIHGRGWIAVVALVVVAGASALLSSISDVGSVTGLQLLIYSSLGLGPLGALRPWWHTALAFVLGTVWALILTVPGWLLSRRAAEQRSVAAVYRALASQLRAVGTPRFTGRRQGLTAALNAAYDVLLTARATAGGRDQRLTYLMALLNQANPVAEAVLTLNREGNRPPEPVIATIDSVAEAIGDGSRPVIKPPPWGISPGAAALRDALSGLAHLVSGKATPPAYPAPRPSPRERAGLVRDQVSGRFSLTFAVRLMASIAVASVMSEVLPLQRSYWVVLTVAIVLKPDFGSVFARAVQRGIGTVFGAVLGAVILVMVPYGPWLLIPFAILAALLPYGRSRNFGLQAMFLTPLVVVLIDLLAPAGWHLALDRLLDTLLGCAIALVIGYAPWPMSWQAHLPGRFAQTIRDVCRYMEEALVTAWVSQPDPAGPSGTGLPHRSRLRRRAFRALSDLRAEFQRTMSEPPVASRQATAWWPALVGLEEVVDAVTATAVAIGHGAHVPSPAAVRALTAALGAVAGAVADGAPPPAVTELPSDEPLTPVTEATRAVLAVLTDREPSVVASR